MEEFIMTDTNTGVKLDVRVYPIEQPKGATVAFGSVTIADMFAVNNIRVVNSDKGLFVAMPQVKDNKGEYRDICFPTTAELRKQLNEAILKTYAQEREKAAPQKESTIQKLQEGKLEAANVPAQAKTEAIKKYSPEL
jgi:stage V sporulation protein G